MFESFSTTSHAECRDTILERLKEPAPGRIQLLTGPRQIGKTTLILDIYDFLGEPAIYAACDGPETASAGFWERLWVSAEERAEKLGVAYVFLDEAHLVSD